MMEIESGRPEPGEYAGYAKVYVDLVPGGDAVAALQSQLAVTLELTGARGEEFAGNFRYAPGKWTLKEQLGHLADCERIFAYRALRIGRNDPTPLPGFEQDGYIAPANANARSLESLAAEMRAVRAATLALFRSFTPADWRKQGTVSGLPVTVRGLAFTAAGHELHHQRILREKYLTAM